MLGQASVGTSEHLTAGMDVRPLSGRSNVSGMTIPSEELSLTAGEFEMAGKESQAVLMRLDKATEALQKKWAGAGKSMFFHHYKEWRTLMEGQVVLLATIALELRAAAAKYEKADA